MPGSNLDRDTARNEVDFTSFSLVSSNENHDEPLNKQRTLSQSLSIYYSLIYIHFDIIHSELRTVCLNALLIPKYRSDAQVKG